MWTCEEYEKDPDYVVYYGVIMQETVGVFKAGEKIDSLVLYAGETVGHYMIEELQADGGVLRKQEVKLTACE